MNNSFYIYVYLDPRESGRYLYENFSFLPLFRLVRLKNILEKQLFFKYALIILFS